MKRILRLRPSPALVIAMIALFISLGGVSYGLARNSVDSREIKNNTVSSRDLKNNSVTSRDVKNGSLVAGDLKPGAIPAGPAGPPGADGRPGRDGANGFGRLSYSFAVAVNANGPGVRRLAPGQQFEGSVPCAPGTFPTGGDTIAFETADPDVLVPEDSYLVASAFSVDETDTPSGWFVSLDNENAFEIDVFVDVICANADQVDANFIAPARMRAVR